MHLKSLNKTIFASMLIAASLQSCGERNSNNIASDIIQKDSLEQYAADRLATYERVRLTTNLNDLTPTDRKILPLLIQAADIMNELFWKQSFPEKDSLLPTIKDDKTIAFFNINYGPWDRLNDNKPFIKGIGPKPAGAGFYPADMTPAELEQSDLKNKFDQYSLIKRNAQGKLESIPYHVAFASELQRASSLLKQAALLAQDPGFKKYLTLRADALVTDKFTASDIAWLEMKNNTLDIIIGPIENYEDKLFNARTAYESYVLIKDKTWSKKLSKYVAMLPAMQKMLPVDAKYKKETPGTDSELNAYDVVYYAGDSNSGSKTIAVNLPNDETIQQEKGTRRSQLKNAMQAKFDKILVPIAQELIHPNQLNMVNFDAFFANVMFHEVAHGMGIKNTINGKGTVRNALKEQSTWLEEGKADVLGLFLVSEMIKAGELEGDIKSFYVTYMAGILRSVRFGAASSHGKANMQCFNFFKNAGAFTRTTEGKYEVNFDKMPQAIKDLTAKILKLQGDGDKLGTEKAAKEQAIIFPELQKDLEKLNAKKIPVDIVFDQGVDVLGVR